LPLSALPDCQTPGTLSAALSSFNACRGVYATQDTATVGFITAGRNTTMPDRDAELSWVAFRQKAQQAAELSLPKPIAQGLLRAMTEIEDNNHLHSGRPDTGMVAFRGSAELCKMGHHASITSRRIMDTAFAISFATLRA
jgi:hypothetical protein